MKKCPYCSRKMASALKWSYSKRRIRRIFKCRNCNIWGYPEDFKNKKRKAI